VKLVAALESKRNRLARGFHVLLLQPLIPQVQQNPQTGPLIREVHVRGGGIAGRARPRGFIRTRIPAPDVRRSRRKAARAMSKSAMKIEAPTRGPSRLRSLMSEPEICSLQNVASFLSAGEWRNPTDEIVLTGTRPFGYNANIPG
jgi:hypothetical protein